MTGALKLKCNATRDGGHLKCQREEKKETIVKLQEPLENDAFKISKYVELRGENESGA